MAARREHASERVRKTIGRHTLLGYRHPGNAQHRHDDQEAGGEHRRR
jgi:hypothetical protein